MLCQNCGERDAVIHVYANVNGRREAVNLCQTCYAQLAHGNQAKNINNNNNQSFGGYNFDDLLRKIQQQGFGANSQPNAQTQAGNGGNNDNSILGNYGTNLTDQAKAGLIDPIIGRDDEIIRVIEILNRRTKNNPVLIGEPGVGKTAVVEGLAQKIVEHAVPEKLRNKEVIQLDVASLVQGTGIRGQFEEKMQQLMNEVKENKNIILFIDEIHEIVGAGSTEGGSLDAGNILKPALARGELQLVGATTLNEFRKIEKDGALARRLQQVMVAEPSIEETLEIIKGIQEKYEGFHNVKYSDEAIEATVRLSDRYITDRQLPDKAIDLLDESGSKKNLTIPFLDRESLKTQIDELTKLKEMATEAEDYEKAAYYRDQLNKYQDMYDSNQNIAEKTPTINASDIQAIIETKTGIPVSDLQESEQNQLIHLDENLKQHVIGQDDAVEQIAKAIRRNRVGLGRQDRPIGSFMFVGPTGVGKTELARQLAIQLFGRHEALVRFDMSEYMEKHAVSKLIGSPPGYVGYDEAGQLTEQIRRQPYSIILLDEIEKAHPDVLNIFLQIMEDGRLTDAQGRTVSFKDTLIIMTSNAGSDGVEASVGFGASKQGKQQSVMNKIGDFFKPEFLNRFDAIIEFQPLTKSELIIIVDLLLDNMNALLANQDIHVTVDDKVKERLVELGYDPKLGARPLRRVIQSQIEDQIADTYLKNSDLHEIHFTTNTDDEIIVSASENENSANLELDDSTTE
ncbi:MULTISPECIES: ATP-dependent Clp protease ATP-binding subunit [Aerococcus]|uniref:ATP-dependent Clp protease ATP-binding subunit n=1 Tax=Aerococcus viridans TaxID=1377 RepID=A0A2N6UBM1_9LACT|nr:MULTISPECIES: ATP-dependent Clp protease ATP-binding subunit [Aerococcus]OFU51348.1 ATP-dependent Clp protease ATP-binding subunit [Aerococcus sp. HMSC10H05]PMC78973.1 ATP-dependent Clp protease ATP-binding subunit [Aerococcus viridans]